MQPISSNPPSTLPINKPKLKRTKTSYRNILEAQEIQKESINDLHILIPSNPSSTPSINEAEPVNKPELKRKKTSYIWEAQEIQKESINDLHVLIPSNPSSIPPINEPKFKRTKTSYRNILEAQEPQKESLEDLQVKSRKAWEQWELEQKEKPNES